MLRTPKSDVSAENDYSKNRLMGCDNNTKNTRLGSSLSLHATDVITPIHGTLK